MAAGNLEEILDFAIAGEQGVRDVVHNLLAELDMTAALAGCASLAEINCEMLATG